MFSSSNQSVATEMFGVMPSDGVNFDKRARAIYVGVGGNIAWIDGKGNANILANVPAGALIQAECLRVNATNTTASAMVGFV